MDFLHNMFLSITLSSSRSPSIEIARSCGCPRMTFRTLLPGLRPRLCSSEISTMDFSPTTIARTVHLPRLNLARGLVLDTVCKTKIHNSRRPVHFLFHNSTASMRYSLCGERTHPICSSSFPRRELQHKSSSTDNLFRYSNSPSLSLTVLSSSFARHNVSSPLQRSLSCVLS